MFCTKCGKEIKNGTSCSCNEKQPIKKPAIYTQKKTVKSKQVAPQNKPINPVMKIIRWFFGGVLIFGSLTESNIFGILCGLTIIPVIYKFINRKWRIIVGVIAFFAFGMTLGQDAYTPSNTEQVATSSEQENAIQTDKIKTVKKEQKVKAVKEEPKLYDDSALDIIPTEKGKGYDKTIDKYGVARIKEINELIPKAADLMSKNKNCDKLWNVALSSNRGTKDNVVIFGDCNNGSRFYLTEKEINESKTALSGKEKLDKMSLDLMNLCDEMAKATLTHPSTFDKSIWRSGVSVDDYKITIVSGFSAKNSFGLELKYKAVCVFNDKPELVDFTITED